MCHIFSWQYYVSMPKVAFLLHIHTCLLWWKNRIQSCVCQIPQLFREHFPCQWVVFFSSYGPQVYSSWWYISHLLSPAPCLWQSSDRVWRCFWISLVTHSVNRTDGLFLDKNLDFLYIFMVHWWLIFWWENTKLHVCYDVEKMSCNSLI